MRQLRASMERHMHRGVVGARIQGIARLGPPSAGGRQVQAVVEAPRLSPANGHWVVVRWPEKLQRGSDRHGRWPREVLMIT